MLAQRALGLREKMTPKERKENPMPTGRFSWRMLDLGELTLPTAGGPVLPQPDLLFCKGEDLEATPPTSQRRRTERCGLAGC